MSSKSTKIFNSLQKKERVCTLEREQKSCKGFQGCLNHTSPHLQTVKVLFHLDLGRFKILPQGIVVRVRRCKELHPSGTQVHYLFKDKNSLPLLADLGRIHQDEA